MKRGALLSKRARSLCLGDACECNRWTSSKSQLVWEANDVQCGRIAVKKRLFKTLSRGMTCE